MSISMNSLCWDFTSRVKFMHTPVSSVSSTRQPISAKFSTRRMYFVEQPVLLSSRPANSTRDTRCLKIPAATDKDTASSESVTAEPPLPDKNPPSPSVQLELNGKETSSSSSSSQVKKSALTSREKLRAARVLSRYNDPKPAKTSLGSKVLDALRESDGGKKRSRLPQAPENLLDDSKRGMPKQGLTFDFPGGADLFFIVLSFVLISTVMFTTTYVVWKLGAIHFNEY